MDEPSSRLPREASLHAADLQGQPPNQGSPSGTEEDNTADLMHAGNEKRGPGSPGRVVRSKAGRLGAPRAQARPKYVFTAGVLR